MTACTIGETSTQAGTVYDGNALCATFPNEAAALASGSGSGSGSSFNWLGTLQSFDFGIFSSAYCNIYPLLNQGNIPPECKPPQTGANGQPEPSEDTPKTGRYLLAILLVVVVAVVSYFLIKRAVKK